MLNHTHTCQNRYCPDVGLAVPLLVTDVHQDLTMHDTQEEICAWHQQLTNPIWPLGYKFAFVSSLPMVTSTVRGAPDQVRWL